MGFNVFLNSAGSATLEIRLNTEKRLFEVTSFVKGLPGADDVYNGVVIKFEPYHQKPQIAVYKHFTVAQGVESESLSSLMTILPTFPVELLAEIVKYLRPHTPIIGRDAPWVHPDDLLNWWDGPRSRPTAQLASDATSSDTDHVETAVSPYAPLIALRQTSKRFNALCVPHLYYVFNCLGPTMDANITSDVQTRYHHHFRVVRISATLLKGSPSQRTIDQLLQKFPEGVMTLGIYFDYHGEESAEFAHEISRFFDEVARVLGIGKISSFGIYCRSAFSEYPDAGHPEAANMLLERITLQEPILHHLKALDVVIEGIHEDSYDAFRTQIASLSLLTLRGALQEDLGKIWEENQRKKWHECRYLTDLQLIQCVSAAAPHVPYILQLFPSLKTLTLVACGDEIDTQPPPREKGWSLVKDALWRDRAPLDALHLEHIFDWEISALGAIHTRQLTILAVLEDGLVNSFGDEELYPQLRILRTDRGHINPELEAICAERGVILESNARALLFHS